MGWRAFNKALDDALPQKDDSPGEIIAKAAMSWAAAPMALLDLLSPDPPSSSGGSSSDQHFHCYPCRDEDCDRR